ncbi:16S rRNA (cytosine(1402)-N(4))-methyltransferase RsmH [Mesomycoplasma hyorhinis]|uniref:16S rRNA (cytosine(1402)-N(4))-methyltransferase RsmH n=1 Tax=Mesomycoplasma hyorhinis TaxID=2100 RepID=UPI00035D09B8|nr:16S rRNA (cytosine(1402)-N(4))-methyltransferase RsmH [Mesomycoplasma hyorhinis]QPC29325.1 16S rRNA (cytosine(1402)-N(4))-methyltransferase RsmH [Mesomycoplasma hyorhinis]
MDHIPVLLDQVIDQLNIKEDGIYLDLTLGRGGHSTQILKKLTSGKLIVFDKDKQAIEQTKEKLLKISSNIEFIWSDFKDFDQELKKLQINKVDGVLLDLGVSSPQLDQANRGFSYNKQARLDMRMNQAQSFSAYELVNEYSKEKLVNIFTNYGQVPFANNIAENIVKLRPITYTTELVDIIKQSLPNFVLRKKNPAKNVFQAIRIEVNQELESLNIFLSKIDKFLKKDGKLAIITFHSLEDKIVKNYFKQLLKQNQTLFFETTQAKYLVKTTWANQKEIDNNKRAKSAKLRVLTKLIN